MMAIGSLFSGIGGLERGLEEAGCGMTVWQVERDPYCRAVLEKDWPHTERHDDVCSVGAHNLQPVDIICGGFPCQPHSLIGEQRGADDERYLWPEFARVIRELRPQFVVVENVAAIVADGTALTVLGDLAALGYDAEWETISACTVGAPHTRERVFIVAHASGERLEGHTWHGDGASEWSESIGPNAARALRDAADAAWWWDDDAGVCRVAHGVPHRVDRIAALGNAVVPQVATLVGLRVMQLAGYE